MGGSLLPILAVLVLSAGTAALSPAPARAADLFLTGEREIYLAVDKLNAMGQFPGFLANTRPYSVAAVRAALDKNAAAGQGVGFDAQLARWVTYATKPTFLVRGTVALEADEQRETRANEGGVPTPKGVSGRLFGPGPRGGDPVRFRPRLRRGLLRRERGPRHPRRRDRHRSRHPVRRPADRQDRHLVRPRPPRRPHLHQQRAELPRHPFHNPVPIAVPLFSFWDAVDLFAPSRTNPYPIGAPRGPPGLPPLPALGGTAGEGGPDRGKRGWSTRSPASTSPSRSRSATSRSRRIWKWRGRTRRTCWAARSAFPSKFAYVTGAFLPSLFGSAAHDLRVEWARNHWRGNGPAWYVHAVSGDGYAHFYRGRVLGHPMSTDAQNLSIQSHHFLLPSTYLELTLSRTDRFSLGSTKERTDRASAGFVGWFSERVRAEAEIAQERVENPGGLPGAADKDASFRVALSYQLGSGK